MGTIRTPSFYITDILSAQISGNKFTQKNVLFSDVILYGVITRSFTIYDEQTKAEILIYTVCDGTGAINCIMELKKDQFQENSIDFEQPKPDSENQMAFLTSIALDRLKNQSEKGVLPFGSDVRIIGRLEHFKDMKYVYMEEVQKVSKLDVKIANLKELSHFYNYLFNVSQ